MNAPGPNCRERRPARKGNLLQNAIDVERGHGGPVIACRATDPSWPDTISRPLSTQPGHCWERRSGHLRDPARHPQEVLKSGTQERTHRLRGAVFVACMKEAGRGIRRCRNGLSSFGAVERYHRSESDWFRRFRRCTCRRVWSRNVEYAADGRVVTAFRS